MQRIRVAWLDSDQFAGGCLGFRETAEAMVLARKFECLLRVHGFTRDISQSSRYASHVRRVAGMARAA
jgi:hypothetical protein